MRGGALGPQLFEAGCQKRRESAVMDPTRGGLWTPARLGTTLKAWYRADRNVLAKDEAAQFVIADTTSLSKALFAAVQPGTGDFSLECWFYADSVAGTQCLMGMGGAGIGVGYTVWVNAGTVGGSVQDAGGYTDFSGGAVSATTWYHLIVTFDRDGNATCYIDGAVSGTGDSIATRSGTLDTGVQAFAIGKTAATYFGGKIQCARVYKATLLSQAQITTLYNNGTPLRYQDLSAALQSACAGAAWDLNEYSDGTGAVTRADSSGGGNSLTDTNTTASGAGKFTRAAVDGDPVFQWSDLSGGGFHLTQATYASRPLLKTGIVNGKPTVLFDGSDDYLGVTASIVASQPIHSFTVFKFVAGLTTNRMLWNNHQTGGPTLYYRQASTAIAHAAGTEQPGTTNPGTTNFHMADSVLNGASSSLSMDGASETTANPGAQAIGTSLNVGTNYNASGGFSNAYIPELILCSSVIGGSNLTSMDRYIQRLYALSYTVR